MRRVEEPLTPGRAARFYGGVVLGLGFAGLLGLGGAVILVTGAQALWHVATGQ